MKPKLEGFITITYAITTNLYYSFFYVNFLLAIH